MDSISNLELNLRYMARVAQMLTQEPIYKSSSIFCFKPILLSAQKLILLIYGDNRVSRVELGLPQLPGLGFHFWSILVYAGLRLA